MRFQYWKRKCGLFFPIFFSRRQIIKNLYNLYNLYQIWRLINWLVRHRVISIMTSSLFDVFHAYLHFYTIYQHIVIWGRPDIPSEKKMKSNFFLVKWFFFFFFQGKVLKMCWPLKKKKKKIFLRKKKSNKKISKAQKFF